MEKFMPIYEKLLRHRSEEHYQYWKQLNDNDKLYLLDKGNWTSYGLSREIEHCIRMEENEYN